MIPARYLLHDPMEAAVAVTELASDTTTASNYTMACLAQQCALQ